MSWLSKITGGGIGATLEAAGGFAKNVEDVFRTSDREALANYAAETDRMRVAQAATQGQLAVNLAEAAHPSIQSSLPEIGGRSPAHVGGSARSRWPTTSSSVPALRSVCRAVRRASPLLDLARVARAGSGRAHVPVMGMLGLRRPCQGGRMRRSAAFRGTG